LPETDSRSNATDECVDTTPLDFELPNVGAGADQYAPTGADADNLVVLLQRDYYCRMCRRQVQQVKRRYDDFRDAGSEVVSVLPDSPERTAKWQQSYDLPFPLLADEGADVREEFDQPRRFGVLGRLHDFGGRMPETLVVDPGVRRRRLRPRRVEPRRPPRRRRPTPGDRRGLTTKSAP
jgi:peroxiredoxin Q/BCP